MARRFGTLTGLIATAAVAAFVAAALLALALAGSAQTDPVPWAYLISVGRFTVLQAVLSTALSTLPALVLAIALARHPGLPGRTLLVRVLALPLALPALVGALAIVSVFGRNGWVVELSRMLGLGADWSIYGLSGILIAHVFFNLTLATRLFLAELDRIPAETLRLASQLALPAAQVARWIEWPVLRTALPGVAGLIFLLCLTSFAIPLILGGGPAKTTFEVAIFQALSYDFDPPRAVALALMQLAVAVGAVALLGRFAGTMEVATGFGRRVRRPPLPGRLRQAGEIALIVLLGLFVAIPLGAIVTDGIAAQPLRILAQQATLNAIATSLGVATGAAVLAICLAGGIVTGVLAARHRRDLAARLVAVAANLIGRVTLAVPPVMLGAGWFVLVLGLVSPFAIAPFVVVAINALLALPFAVQILSRAARENAERTDRLAANLALTGMTRLRIVTLPALARPLGLAFALAMALSLGDLGAASLYGNADFTTLPVLLSQRMGSYRTDDAAALALILGLLCLGLMAVAERLMRQEEQ